MTDQVTKQVNKMLDSARHGIFDTLSFLFPKRARRVRWANELTHPDIGPTLNNGVVLFEDGKYSVLGWGCCMFFSSNRKEMPTDHQLIVDGVIFREFMPSHIRKWFGIDEMQALKVQALNLNGADENKISNLIKSF